MTLLGEAKRAVKAGIIKPKRKLGQSFVTNKALLQRMVRYADIENGSIVTEIGAGLGFLTRELARVAGEVVAIEIDSGLVKELKREVGQLRNVEIVRSDALKSPLVGFNKIVANPPYYISSPLLFTFLRLGFQVAVITLQKEFAQRLIAPPGSKDYGRLTVSIKYRASTEVLEVVSKNAFYPRPEVDSAVVRIVPRIPHPKARDEEVFNDVVRYIFTQRNKKVRNAIVNFVKERVGIRDKKGVKEFIDSIPFGNVRVRELSPQDAVELSDHVVFLMDRRSQSSNFRHK